jgi:hypothetical protein
MDIREEGETMKKLEELEQVAKAGKRAETDYGQSYIRRIADQTNFEEEFNPDVILSLLRELKITHAALYKCCFDLGMESGLLLKRYERKLYPETEQP